MPSGGTSADPEAWPNAHDEHFDVLIVGSGFGGSVTAYRLAEAGFRVCLLERGKAYPPNSFPRDPFGTRSNFWDPSAGLYGLYNVWSFKGSGAIVSSGLGGGSLIYANVLLRKDEAWFKDNNPSGSYTPWPVQYVDLDPHYGRVEQMMNAQQYPFAHPPYSSTPKTKALRDAAASLRGPGQEPTFVPLNLAVSFRARPVSPPDADDPTNPPLVGASIHEPHPNVHGAARSTCRLCGECDLGCNYGSKNTLDYTYISAAARARTPADIRTLCEVKTIERASGGYCVSYLRHDPARLAGQRADTSDTTRFPRSRIRCRILILAAGSLGTTYLLLKNASNLGLDGCRPLGTRYSVNGDLLSFVLGAKRSQDGARTPWAMNSTFGPVITGALRYDDSRNSRGELCGGFYVQDGGHPYLLSWLAELAGIRGYLWRLMKFVALNVRYRLGLRGETDLGARLAELLGDCISSRSSLPLLAMGRDHASGHLALNGQYLECDWAIQESRAYYRRVEGELRRVAEFLGGKYRDNPAFAWNFHQVLSAHPLGGCPMGVSDADGVVDSFGRVFGHDALYVADGSIVPGPVGSNPSLTIAALADRLADHIIDKTRTPRVVQ